MKREEVVALVGDLMAIGLTSAQTTEIVLAKIHNCDFYVTLAPEILDRREALEVRCFPMRFGKPTDALAAVKASAGES